MSADLKQNKINPEGTIYLINNFTLIVFYVRYMETALKKKRKRKLTKIFFYAYCDSSTY